jgi:hypothetical protein
MCSRNFKAVYSTISFGPVKVRLRDEQTENSNPGKTINMKVGQSRVMGLASGYSIEKGRDSG